MANTAPVLRWYVCDLVTGLVLDELPLTTNGTITRQIAQEQAQTLQLATADPKCPPDWTSRLVPGKTMIVLTIDDFPIQAWEVDDYECGTSTVDLATTSLERCMASTNVPDLDAYDMDMSQALAELCGELPARFGFTIAWTPCGTKAAQDYSTLEDRNVLAAAQELNQAAGGPEWRIKIDWTDATRRFIAKSIEIAPRIGEPRPDAVFDLDRKGRGVIDTYKRRVSFAAGRGATLLIGTSDGSGSSRPMTDPIVSSLVAAGWPVWEERKNFTGLDDATDEDAALFDRTLATLQQRERGRVIWTVTGTAAAPRPGAAFVEGDTVYLDVAPQGKADPVGGTAAARVMGWELDPASGRVTPTFQEEQDDG